MTDVISTLWVVLGLKDDASARIEAAITRTEKAVKTSVGGMAGSLKGWRDEMNESTRDLGKYAAAFAVPIAVATTMIATTNMLIESAQAYQDQIEQVSIVTDMSAESTQKWRAATVATDTEFSAFAATMTYLNQTIGDTGATGNELRSTLDSLGISYRKSNGELIDNDTLMKNILTRLSGMKSVQERDAAAKAILGRSWYNLAEMIANADDAMVAYQNHTPAFSQKDLDDIDEYKLKWAELADQVELAKAKLALPIMNALMGIEQVGAETGVKYSGAVMAAGGLPEYLMTGNRAQFLEGIKRVMNPEKFTREALEEQQKGALAAQGKSADLAGKFTDSYAGLATKEIELALITEKLTLAETNRAAALSQAEYNKYSLEIAQLTAHQKDLHDAMNEAGAKEAADTMKKYEDAVKDVADEMERLNEINRDFERELSILNPRDVSGARDLLLRHQWAVEDQNDRIASAKTAADGVANYGDLVINIDGKQVSRIPGVAATSGERSLMQAGY